MRSIYLISFFLLFACISLDAQDYFYQQFEPYDSSIPSPEQYLEYGIGDYHTRHDQIVSYLEAIAATTDRASLMDYGKTHERRRLVMLQISAPDHLTNLEKHRQRHLELVDPSSNVVVNSLHDLPVFVNLAFNVHGNEPSGSESALLAAYVLAASNHPEIVKLREGGVTFLDPCINPDGRDRHTQWANSRRGVEVLVKDPQDAEHQESWPRGRTNHFWFDLNRDWLLAVHPESQGKLEWYHKWYPNVVTDFHEMGTNSSYFFEPMKTNGSEKPIMPEENYTTLNDKFAEYYVREMDKIGSLYFTKEVFDGTYPGYGSSYPDLQGGLGILFEQASSRGHVQETPLGDLTFAFTIRNQFVNAIATVEAAVENKALMHRYQRDFFKSALSNARSSGIKSYIISEMYDKTRMTAFLDLLLQHKVKVYKSNNANEYIIPTEQPQYRMVQTMFETYDTYQDSVYYDASAWSLANAYNIDYRASRGSVSKGAVLTAVDLATEKPSVDASNYAYLIPWDEYSAPALLYQLQSEKVKVLASQKEFTMPTTDGNQKFSYGTLVIPVQKQSIEKGTLLVKLQKAATDHGVKIFAATTGYATSGTDLGSGQNRVIKKPKAAVLVGDGVSGYEAGFVWHLLDQRVNMPLSKLRTVNFKRTHLSNYNTLIIVSGSYQSLDSTDIASIKAWTAEGNTLITIREGTQWAIKNKLVKEKLIKKAPTARDSVNLMRFPYIHAREIRGREAVGGAIFEVDLDLTHPIAYGYHDRKLPVYRNSTIWLQPSKGQFSNVAVYTKDPHIDGFITKENMDKYLKKSASIITSKVGAGRAVLFVDDPNFRGTWYGTNKLFLNAIFFGDLIRTF